MAYTNPDMTSEHLRIINALAADHCVRDAVGSQESLDTIQDARDQALRGRCYLVSLWIPLVGGSKNLGC